VFAKVANLYSIEEEIEKEMHWKCASWVGKMRCVSTETENKVQVTCTKE
jgi:hypothetical protein